MDRRKRNIEIFRDTQYRIATDPRIAFLTRKSIDNTCVIDGIYKSRREPRGINTRISFTQNPSLVPAVEMARKYKKTAVLNFANATRPGGGVLKGAVAQEEYICRLTNLYNCLISEAASQYYKKHKELRNRYYNSKNFVATDSIVYSPDILVFKECKYGCEYSEDEKYGFIENSKEWVQINIITCAAPYFADSQFCLPDRALEEIFTKRIRNIFEVAIEYKIESLVLGAFGCGAFNNPPELVAKTFNMVLNEERYVNAFSDVIFAVTGSGRHSQNVNVFKDYFNISCKNKGGAFI